MAESNRPEMQKANHGERMIEVRVRFWTNDIVEGQVRGEVLPKHAWSSGVVAMDRNETHGISPEAPKPFHTLMDMPSVIEKVLIQHGVVLHPSDKMQKYVNTAPDDRK